MAAAIMSRLRTARRAGPDAVEFARGQRVRMWGRVSPGIGKSAAGLFATTVAGRGGSGTERSYSMERFGRDVLSTLDDSKSERPTGAGCRWAAWSGSGWGRNAPDRVEKLVLSNTNYHYADKAPWNDRIKLVNERPRRTRPGKHGAMVYQGFLNPRAQAVSSDH